MKGEKLSEKDKKDFTDAFNACRTLLKINNHHNNNAEDDETITMRSVIMGQEMYESMLKILKKMTKSPGDIIPTDSADETSTNPKVMKQKNRDKNKTVDQNKRTKCSKKKIEESSRLNNKPKFSKNNVTGGESVRSVMRKINNWVYVKYKKYMEKTNNNYIDDKIIKELGLEAKKILWNKSIPSDSVIRFCASDIWIQKFKKRYFPDNHENNESDGDQQQSHVQQNHNDLQKKKKLQIPRPENKINESSKSNNSLCHEDAKDARRTSKKNFNTIMKKINNWVRVKYKQQTKKTYERIGNKLIQKWGLEAKEKFWNNRFNPQLFCASRGWVRTFKKNYLKEDESDNDDDEDNLDVQQNHDDIDEVNSSGTIAKKINSNKTRKCHVTFEEKQRVVAIARQHPGWKLAKLRKITGCDRLLSLSILRKWEEQVEFGGNNHDKKRELKSWVLDKLMEYKRNNGAFSNSIIRDLALQAKNIFIPGNRYFRASDSWIQRFKSLYKITDDNFDKE